MLNAILILLLFEKNDFDKHHIHARTHIRLQIGLNGFSFSFHSCVAVRLVAAAFIDDLFLN